MNEKDSILDEIQPQEESYTYDLTFLDSLGLHFLCLDADKQPSYISSAAAKFFELDNADLAKAGAVIVAPLIELAYQVQMDTANAVRRLTGLPSHPNIHALNLLTAKGRQRSVVAFTERLGSERNYEDALIDRDFHTVVFFYDLSPLDAVSMILRQARICRELYLQSVIKLLHFEKRNSLLTATNNPEETTALESKSEGYSSEPALSTDGLLHSEEVADLLSSVHRAVQIMDNCILKSVSLTIKANTSALIPILEADLVMVVIGMFNQACEFVGLCGKLNTSVELKNNSDPQASAAYIKINAQRYSALPNYEDPLAFFVYQHCLPHFFGRVPPQKKENSTVLDEHEQLSHLSNNGNSLIDEFTEKLRSVIGVLRIHSGELQINIINENEIDLVTKLPLVKMTR